MKTVKDKHLSLGFALAGFGTLLFSLKSIFIKYLYAEGMNADEVLVLRMALSLPIYMMILVLSLRNRSTDVALNFQIIIKIFMLGFFGYYLASLLDLMSLELISAQLERLGLFTYPFMVALLGHFFFNEQITRRIIFSLVITYAGLYVVVGQELKLTGDGVIEGTFLVLGAALSFAFYVLFSKRYINQLGSQLFTCIAMISSCGFGLLHGVIVLQWSDLAINQVAWLWLFMLVVLSTVIPSFLMVEALNRIGATQSGIVGMLGPIITIALAIYLLGEPFSVSLVFGVALMMVGVANLMMNKDKNN
ncbi:MAG: DMT family transporter [Gammaproteobacteria bacterium]|nr:DMT family transporter [Gammaproteobacteria bacterium]